MVEFANPSAYQSNNSGRSRKSHSSKDRKQLKAMQTMEVKAYTLKQEENDQTAAERAGIKKLKAGPKYVPSETREMRDQLKSFTARQDLKDQTYDKLYKVLATDLTGGFPKNELIDFLQYMQRYCKLNKDLLDEADLEKMFKSIGMKDVKNNKDVLEVFLGKCLQKQLDWHEFQLEKDPNL